MKIAIKDQDGLYLTVEKGGGLVYSPNEVKVYYNLPYPGVAPAYCRAKEIGPWETFEVEEQDDTSFTLLTCEGFYLTAEEGGGYGLSTNRKTAGEWERFYPIDGGLRTSGGYFLRSERGADRHMNCASTSIQSWETFEIVDLDPQAIVDPSSVSLRTIAAIRGAMWTVRGPWQYGPRPGDPTNITALEYIYSYGDPYGVGTIGSAFNLNLEQTSMIDTYKSWGYTHGAFGPITAQSYHGQYPDYFFTAPDTFDRWLDWLQMFWNNGIIPICFLHPDGASLDETKAIYEPLIRNNPRAQKLMRCIVPSGWEPAKYEWSSYTWAEYAKWGHDILPNALILIHTVPDVDAPGGTDALGDDNGRGNNNVWHTVAPHIHGWLTQSSAFDTPEVHGDPNHPEMTNYDNWTALFDKNNEKSYWNRFHNGYAGWPTNSLWGDEPIYIYAGEYCSYWSYWDNRPYDEGCAWGDRALSVGADGYFDAGSSDVPEKLDRAKGKPYHQKQLIK